MTEGRKIQELMGAPGSPYTRKMLGVMRFRHIPYRLERQSRIANASEDRHRKQRVQAKVPLLPTFYFDQLLQAFQLASMKMQIKHLKVTTLIL